MIETEPRGTMLDRWKALAEMENERARRIWGNSGGTYRRPESFEDPEVTAARQKRDDQIEAWAAAGLSTREICARVGMVETSVNRILRIRRLAGRDNDRAKTGRIEVFGSGRENLS